MTVRWDRRPACRTSPRPALGRAACLAVALLVPVAGEAQVGSPLPQAIGMGDNFTALARGFGAVYWNPAGLGMPDNALVSAAFLPVTGTAGLGPVTPGDIAAYDGERIPHDSRARWLDRIRAEGGERGTFATDLTYVAVSVGRVAFSASSSVRARVNMGPDAAELVLFGNAGLTGEPRDFSLEGSRVDAAGTTTLAASIGLPLRVRLGPLPDQNFAIGATVKYTVGNFLLMGQEEGGTLSTSPLEVDVRFPLIHTAFPDEDDDGATIDFLRNGAGVGLDIGAAWRGGDYFAGVTIRNLVHTFEWDRDALRYRSGVASWTADTATTHFEERPFAEAPAELVDRVAGFHTYAPVLAAGAAARVLPYLVLSGDVRHALADNLEVGERTHLGVGGELTIVPFLPVRAGLAAISGGYQASAGIGLRLGGVQLAAAAALRQAELGREGVGALALTFGIR
jgi:hypothetical protein